MDYYCCLIGLCCPPFSDEQREKLIAIRMAHDRRVSRDEAEHAVDFDLAQVKRMRASTGRE